MKYLFVSDLHLGSPLFKYESSLIRLLKGDYEKVFMVGDIFDVWQKRFNKLVLKYSELVYVFNELGNKLEFILGNHDAPVDELRFMFPKVIISNYSELDGFVIKHGHQYDDSYKFFSKIFFIQKLFEKFGINIKAFLRNLCYDRTLMEIVSDVEKQAVHDNISKRGIIMGHTHLPKLVKIDGFFYINTGSLIYDPSYVEYDGKKFELRRLKDDALRIEISVS